MTKATKSGIVTFSPGQPMRISDDISLPPNKLTESQEEIIDIVGKSIKAYLSTAQELLDTKFAALRNCAPSHLLSPGNALVGCCEEGIVIRYEPECIEKRKIFGAWIEDRLENIVPMISENVVFCHHSIDLSLNKPIHGIDIRLAVIEQSGKSKDIFNAKMRYDVLINRPAQMPLPPRKPFSLFSVRNSLVLNMVGEFYKNEQTEGKGKKFLLRNKIRLPVGWECIEVFPFYDINQWKPEYAAVWAENDILASVVTHQQQEAELRTLDPNVEARRRFKDLLNKYKELLDKDPEREEILQCFLKENPVFLCPAHTRFWPKLPLGNKETDFVFRDATGDYILVELERSTAPLFRKDGHPSGELNVARGQILDWKRYIEDNLRTVQYEVGLLGISTNPRSMIVIGRSHILSDENRRKIATLENENPKVKIYTYDDVLINTKAVIENLFGPLWEEASNTEVYYYNK